MPRWPAAESCARQAASACSTWRTVGKRQIQISANAFSSPRHNPLPYASLPTVTIHLQLLWTTAIKQCGARWVHASNFTPGFTAPPHYLATAAGAIGLDFIALADTLNTSPGDSPAPGPHAAGLALGRPKRQCRHYLRRSQRRDPRRSSTGKLAGKEPRPCTLAGGQDTCVNDADSCARRQQRQRAGRAAPAIRRMGDSERPLLPGGSVNPPLPGRYVPAPRYTGLAVTGEARDL